MGTPEAEDRKQQEEERWIQKTSSSLYIIVRRSPLHPVHCRQAGWAKNQTRAVSDAGPRAYFLRPSRPITDW
jgi:hypothetical protein